MTKSAMKRLGERLSADTGPSDEDLRQLETIEHAYGAALAHAVARVKVIVGAKAYGGERRIQVTSRVKTVATLLDKVRGGSALGRIQDIAGMRVVGAFGLVGQDEIMQDIAKAFEQAKVADRRERPNHAYRAVHIVVDADELPVEIQVRTVYQHIWANANERLADVWGRGIRYGKPPIGDDAETIALRSRRLASWMVVSERLYDIEQAAENSLRPKLAGAAALGLDTRDLPAVARYLMKTDPELTAPQAAFRDALRACGNDISRLVLSVMNEIGVELGLP